MFGWFTAPFAALALLVSVISGPVAPPAATKAAPVVVTMTNALGTYTAASITLPAGTWLISAVMNVDMPAASPGFEVTIWSGNVGNILLNQTVDLPVGVSEVVLPPMVLQLAAGTTINLAAMNPTVANGVIRAGLNNGVPGTYITAQAVSIPSFTP